ncbi:serine/threonine-protein phosphatase [Actinoallomurus purpureus]|uniref:PP2C family protein-serine/threonine phosphatase n=1 Tax=Actinoallomurus purpureus TaxID=478114 RepID=UPI002093DB7C|nr:PP2C family protein-serine/threonine phosphatase [Actinoallomurus purpureus]MCO6008600.1 serine/threonine-protein phosphatase [Actinoallomurus purpureus]
MRRFGKHRSVRSRSWRQGRALVVLPLALIAVIVAADVLNGPRIHLGPLLIVAPAITASFAGPGSVALIGLVAVAAEVLTGAFDRWSGVAEFETQLSSLVLISGLIVFFTAVRQRHRRELKAARSVAETAQRALMRPLPERIGPLCIASLYLTAEQEAKVGGDLFGAARIAGGTRLIIGDVRGKGLAAVDTSALVVGAFRAAAHLRSALPDLLSFLDGAAEAEPARTGDGDPGPGEGEGFVTAAVLDIPDEEPRVRVANRGHPPPLLLTPGGGVTELRAGTPAPPLGLGELSPDENDVDAFPFHPGDLLLLYTDGVIEARDATGTFYPLAERLASWREDDPAPLVERLHEDLRAYVDGSLDDDVAVIAIKRMPAR